MGALLLLLWPLPIVGIYNFGMWGICINWRKPIAACKTQCRSLSQRLTEPLPRDFQATPSYNDTRANLKRKSAVILLNIQLDCFTVHGTTMSANILGSVYMQSFGIGNSLRNYRFYVIATSISKCKGGAKKKEFQSEIKFDLEGQGQSTLKSIGTLSKSLECFGSNLMILAGACDAFSRGEKNDGHTHTQAMTTVESQYWWRVKILKNKADQYVLVIKSDLQSQGSHTRYDAFIMTILGSS